MSAFWKSSHSDIQGRPCFRQRSTAARRFQIAHILWVAGKEGEKHPCKTHPIRRKMFLWKKKIKKRPFASISLVNSPVYQKCSLRSIIAQITFKQMSEGPLFVWLKLSQMTTHFNTSFLQYRLIKNKPSILCFPILILMNISLWVSSGISLRSDLHGVAADSWYMQSCKTQTHKSPKGLDFPEKNKTRNSWKCSLFAGFLTWPFPLRSPVKSVVRMELGVWGAWGKAASSASAGAWMTVRSQGHQVLSLLWWNPSGKFSEDSLDWHCLFYGTDPVP